MNAQLLVVLDNTIKRRVALQLPAVLGRSRGADITVTHPLISRRHCEISENNGLLMLRDLASLNGTMIGGRRIALAPLLPDAEFTIGPLTFRVLYEYGGDLESVPDTRFVDAVQGTTEAGPADPPQPRSCRAEVAEVPLFEVEEVLPVEPASESRGTRDSGSGELAMPDILALADAEPDELLPVAPASGGQAPADASADVLWQPVVVDALPPPPPDEPMEDDSSLQSGGRHVVGHHVPMVVGVVGKASPWGVDLPAVGKPQHPPKASAGKGPPAQPETPPDATSAEKVAKPPVKEKPPPASPPKKPDYGDEMDPEFGSFLEGLE